MQWRANKIVNVNREREKELLREKIKNYATCFEAFAALRVRKIHEKSSSATALIFPNLLHKSIMQEKSNCVAVNLKTSKFQGYTCDCCDMLGVDDDGKINKLVRRALSLSEREFNMYLIISEANKAKRCKLFNFTFISQPNTSHSTQSHFSVSSRRVIMIDSTTYMATTAN